MARATLSLSIGQCSDRGRKPVNQDFHGSLVPDGAVLALKGAVVALADGISSSSVSDVAAETAVKSFVTDYYCTSDAWSVQTSAARVISATNSWLYAETRRNRHLEDANRGYVCTFSALVFKSRSAHLFHIGDTRVFRVAGASLEQLTTDHRLVLSSQENYLDRALGMAPQVEIDTETFGLSVGEIFVLATDGVYEHAAARFVTDTIHANPDNLGKAARLVVAEALERGSADNLTVQIVRVDALPDGDAQDFLGTTQDLPVPTLPEPRQELDGYAILRRIHGNSRSHIYLAQDLASGERVALKIPSVEQREDPDYLRRFMMEEWIARRLNSAHVLKAPPPRHARRFLYVVTEFIEGQTLRQWMIDNPVPDLDTVRGIVEQISRGLRAFHRREMVHQDLRPENIMIDQSGTVKIIDFGATRVAGVAEAAPDLDRQVVLGTVQYTAPEYFIGDPGSPLSDLFSLGVITYEMLTGKLPYGADVSRARSRSQQARLRYRTADCEKRPVPAWIDAALRRALHPDPFKRYQAKSEFVADLRRPNRAYASNGFVPLAKRDPVRFWQSMSAILAAVVVMLLLTR